MTANNIRQGRWAIVVLNRELQKFSVHGSFKDQKVAVERAETWTNQFMRRGQIHMSATAVRLHAATAAGRDAAWPVR